MFNTASLSVNFNKENKIIYKKVNLDKNLDFFVLISSGDENLPDLILNKILDSIINKISTKDTYNDFSITLEVINSFLKTWIQNNEKIYDLDIVMGILNRNNFIFSNIGSSSCYLVKNNEQDIIEITEKHENKKFFGFISSGELNNDEIIILGTKRLLNHLSNSDLLDGGTGEKVENFVQNIKYILKSELINENIGITAIKYNTENFHIEKVNIFEEIKHFIMNLADNKVIKKIIAYYLLAKDYIGTKSKNIRNVLFGAGALISFIILFITIQSLVSITNNTKEKEESIASLFEAKKYIQLASENIGNPEIFEININKSEELVDEINNKDLYLNDIKKIRDDIDIIKKQFNKVETFEVDTEDILYKDDFTDSQKIIKNNGKYYIIFNKGIIGPMIPGKKPEKTIFKEMETNETFIDGVVIGNDIFLLTSLSNIVSFSKTGHFKYFDVESQAKWENAKAISTYSKNIYLVGKDDNQIYKHKLSGSNFLSSIPYISKEDTSEIGEILSIGIDGGIYVLKKDLSLIKMFKDPKYRIESIILNELPENYDIEDPDSKIEIKTDTNSNYFYLLLNKKIWVFEPNTRRFQNTKSLTYIGQIEGKTEDIIDFYINHDGEIIILDNSSVSKLELEITKERLIIR